MKKRMTVYVLVLSLLFVVAIPCFAVGAVSETFDMYVNETWADSEHLSSYNTANLQYTYNYATSADGVNCYIDYRRPDNTWVEAFHVLVEPGDTYGSQTNKNFGLSYAVSSERDCGSTTWRGVMTSWWLNGKNIRATSKFHAYND